MRLSANSPSWPSPWSVLNRWKSCITASSSTRGRSGTSVDAPTTRDGRPNELGRSIARTKMIRALRCAYRYRRNTRQKRGRTEEICDPCHFELNATISSAELASGRPMGLLAYTCVCRYCVRLWRASRLRDLELRDMASFVNAIITTNVTLAKGHAGATTPPVSSHCHRRHQHYHEHQDHSQCCRHQRRYRHQRHQRRH